MRTILFTGKINGAIPAKPKKINQAYYINNRNLSKDTVSFCGNSTIEETTDPEKKDPIARTEFLMSLHNYKGNFFVKNGSKRNELILKLLDPQSLIEDKQTIKDSEYAREADRDEVNLNIYEILTKHGLTSSETFEEFLKEEFDTNEKDLTNNPFNKMLSGDLNIFDKDQLESYDEYLDILYEYKGQLADSIESKNYVKSIEINKYGSIVKVQLPDKISDSEIKIIKKDLNTKIQNEVNDKLISYLLPLKGKIILPNSTLN